MSLYHREVYWKNYFDKESKKIINSIDITNPNHISYHLLQHICGNDIDYLERRKHNIDIVSLTSQIIGLQGSTSVFPFEVEVNNGHVTKCVVRAEYDENRDISIAFRYRKVVTAWLNNKNDKHRTLDDSKYEKEWLGKW